MCLTAIDGNKASFTKALWIWMCRKDDVILLQRHLVKDSVVIADGNMSYRKSHDIKLKSSKVILLLSSMLAFVASGNVF